MTPAATSHGIAAIWPDGVVAALNFQSTKSLLSWPAEYGSASKFSPASRNWPTMLVSRPITSGTPCPAARAARYFLLISPKGCSTKLILTPGCDCSNSGITVCIDVLSKYHTVSSLAAGAISLGPVPPAAGAPTFTGAGWGVGGTGAGPIPHAVIDTDIPAIADNNVATRNLPICGAPPTSFSKIEWRQSPGLDQPLDVICHTGDRPKIGDLPRLDVRGLDTKYLRLACWPSWPDAKYEGDQRSRLPERAAHLLAGGLAVSRPRPGRPRNRPAAGRAVWSTLFMKAFTRKVWRSPVRH